MCRASGDCARRAMDNSHSLIVQPHPLRHHEEGKYAFFVNTHASVLKEDSFVVQTVTVQQAGDGRSVSGASRVVRVFLRQRTPLFHQPVNQLDLLVPHCFADGRLKVTGSLAAQLGKHVQLASTRHPPTCGRHQRCIADGIPLLLHQPSNHLHVSRIYGIAAELVTSSFIDEGTEGEAPGDEGELD